uniref:FA complementation group A n=1 Tax=Leptobrachium leishanense TaxID=445787 RepID=A0A8C5R0W5_9ANUR
RPESSQAEKAPECKGTFVASALRAQAFHLGLPVGVVTARAAVSRIQQICQISVDRAKGAVLNPDQREGLTCLLSTLKKLLEENCFCRSLFSKEFWEQQVTRGVFSEMYTVADTGLLFFVRLLAFDVPRYRTRLMPESIERFYIHTLTKVLTYKPQLRVSDAIRFQGNWSFVKTSPLLTDLHRKLFVVLDAARLTAHIKLVLESQEVNWHHVLTCVSCLVICQAEAQRLLKDLLSHLLTQAFTHYELECLITSFLIARQAALEGPMAFMSYTEWFKTTYGSASSCHNSSKKSLVFLLKLLSDLVPFESPQYLKVHILHPPFVQTKNRPLLMEYISLAKTRLADMKVSIEDMGLYEDLSAEPDKKQSQAQQDVEKAVQIFQTTGKIPASVMEASIFRRPYFASRFLPALLAPRVVCIFLQIYFMGVEQKIPANLYGAYAEACEQERIQSLEGRKVMDVSLHEEPLLRLKSALWDLRPLVTDSSRYSDVSSQLAVISDRLSDVMRNGSAEEAPALSIQSPGALLQSHDQAAADLLLTCFCHCVMAASRTNPPDRQGPWPSLYVKMLCGHRSAVAAVLGRLLQLFCDQAPFLKDAHIVGLAVFAIHLHECQTALPIAYTSEHPLEKFWETFMNPKCSNTMLVCLRFCISAVCYALCRFPSLFQDAASGSIPPLVLRKLQHLVPRLIQEARGEGLREEEVDTPLVWRALSLPNAAWKESAITLWHQSHFQEVLRRDSSQVKNEAGCDYQRWAMNQVYLPGSSSSGGCDGDVRRACSVIVNAVMDFSNSVLSCFFLIALVQEAACDLLMVGHQRPGRVSPAHVFFQIFHERLASSDSNLELSAGLRRQGELEMCCRILLGLPPLLLITAHPDRGRDTLQPDDFYRFVNEELKNCGPRGCALPYNIIAHFFKAVLTSCSQCVDPVAAVNTLLLVSRSTCPVVLSSAALWWPQICPALRCQWDRVVGGALPEELVVLQEIQAAVDSCLSHGLPLCVTGPPWLQAAFLHFTVQRKISAQKTIPECLANTSATSTPDGAESKTMQETCLRIIHCLDERGDGWVCVFQPTEQNEEPVTSLRRVASEEFIKLLPFDSVCISPKPGLVEGQVRETLI